MAQKTIAELKSFFLTGLRPTQQNFHDWLDSFLHKSEGVLITTITADTATGDVTINFTSGDPFVFNVTPQNIAIENVQGLQDVLNNFVVSQAGYGLTQNNFTNEQVNQLQTLASYITFLQSYSGDFSVKRLSFSYLNPIDTSGQTLDEKLSVLNPPFIIAKGQILSVDYYALEPSDGDIALVKSKALFALPAGTYGDGNLNVPEASEIFNSYQTYNKAKNIILGEEYPLIDLIAIDNGNIYPFMSASQETYNIKIYDLVTAIYGEVIPLRGRDFSGSHAAQWNDDTPIALVNGESFNINTVVKILNNATIGFNVLAQIDNTDNIDGTIIRRFYIGYEVTNAGVFFTCWLEEAKSNTYYKQWSFTTLATGVPEGFFNFSAQVNIVDFATESFTAVIGIGNEFFSLDENTITYDYATGAYAPTNYPQNNRICWQNFYPAKVLMSNFSYDINGISRNFSLDQKTKPYSREGVGMNFTPNYNNFWDLSETCNLYVKPSAQNLKSMSLKDVSPSNDTDIIDLSSYLLPDWSGKLNAQIIDNKIIRFFIDCEYTQNNIGDINFTDLADKLPDFMYNQDFKTSKSLVVEKSGDPDVTRNVLAVLEGGKIRITAEKGFDFEGMIIRDTLITFDLVR